MLFSHAEKGINNYKVSCLDTPLLCRYKENYVTRNEPEEFRDRPLGSKTRNLEIKVIDSMRSPYSINFAKRQIIVRPKKIQKRCLRFEDR